MVRARALIAVVDDEAPIRRALFRLISAAGYEVVCFEDGAVFLASLAAARPDCVVLDVHMPGLSGLDVQTRLRDAGPRIPVIVITGQDNDAVRDRILAGGTSAYLRKPVDQNVLLDSIAVALSSGGNGAHA